jgi:hypothetical protein
LACRAGMSKIVLSFTQALRQHIHIPLDIKNF